MFSVQVYSEAVNTSEKIALCKNYKYLRDINVLTKFKQDDLYYIVVWDGLLFLEQFGIFKKEIAVKIP